MKFGLDEIEAIHEANLVEAWRLVAESPAWRELVERRGCDEIWLVGPFHRKRDQLAAEMTRQRVDDGDWAKYKDSLARREQRKGRDSGGGQRAKHKQPAAWTSWSPFENDFQFSRAERRANKPIANPFDEHRPSAA